MNGLWMLAWRRLRCDRAGMTALFIVGGFVAMALLSACGLVASDWEREVAVSYAPPWLMAGPVVASAASPWPSQAVRPGPAPAPMPEPAQRVAAPAASVSNATASGAAVSQNPFDPLADDIAALRAGVAAAAGAEGGRMPALLFGADKWGHDILKKTVKGAQTSVVVGLVAAVLAVTLGTVLGALSGFYGGWIDDVLNWFYSVFTAIPAILMILAVAAVLQQKGVTTIVLILGLTGWTGPYRLMRAEYMKHRARDYVLAAQAIGASNGRRMLVHIFPNVSHVALVQLAILAVGFIKAEVILSFLGFGVPVGAVSWGSMLNEAQQELLLGKWWQLVAASSAMALLVTALSLLTDALRDALDPKARRA